MANTMIKTYYMWFGEHVGIPKASTCRIHRPRFEADQQLVH